MLIDTHCHLDFPKLLSRLDDVLEAAKTAGVGRITTISTHVSRYEMYRTLAEQYAQIFFTVGTHPHNAAEEPDTPVNTLTELSKHPRCIGIGEAGLDYHYNFAPHDIQQKVFRAHITAARQTGLPLVIHAREADDDMIAILQDEMTKGAFKAVLHCFSSSQKLAEVGIDLGLYFSFSGILTYKRADDVRAIAALIPHNKVLVETDAPYLAPDPFRSKTNEPAYVAYTAKVLGNTLGLSEEDIAHVTTDNFYRLFSKAAALDGR